MWSGETAKYESEVWGNTMAITPVPDHVSSSPSSRVMTLAVLHARSPENIYTLAQACFLRCKMAGFLFFISNLSIRIYIQRAFFLTWTELKCLYVSFMYAFVIPRV